MLGKRLSVNYLGGWIWNLIPFDPSVQPVSRWTTSRSKEVVEASVNRRIKNWFGVVDSFDRVQTILMNRSSFRIHEREPNVPFPNTRRCIPLGTKHLGNSKPLFFNQAWSASPCEYAGVIQAKRHVTGQQTVSSGGAYSGWAMCIGESHPGFGEPIDIRCWDL